ncbi:MAG: ABC transporter permease [Proteobacteria bacterium]|nr:ABC transporter permease [Pseudomonadota bacterium]
MKEIWGRIITIAWKEVVQMRRDKGMFPLIFIAPIIQLLMFGYAATLDVENLPTAVYDQDETPASREYIGRFQYTRYFHVRYHVKQYAEIEDLIDRNKVKVALVIPVGFEKKIKQGQRSPVQIIMDGTNSNTATIAFNYAGNISQQYSVDLLLKQQGASGAVKSSVLEDRLRVWYNPELKSQVFMIPGVLVMILLIMTMIFSGLSIVREKEIGTMEQLMVTPIRPGELIIGKLLPFVVIGFFDVALVTSIAVFWFRLPLKGDVFLLFGLAGIFIMCTLGLGIFVSTISRTQQQAVLTNFFITFPSIILSGFMFPIENMPQVIQYITYLIPIRYFLVIVRGIFLKGNGLDVLWPQALVLFLFGVTLLTMSSLRFRKRIK